jgi:hypothetical protein
MSTLIQHLLCLLFSVFCNDRVHTKNGFGREGKGSGILEAYFAQIALSRLCKFQRRFPESESDTNHKKSARDFKRLEINILPN